MNQGSLAILKTYLHISLSFFRGNMRGIASNGPDKYDVAERYLGPLDRFSTVERNWEDGTVAYIGGEPSLTETQVRQAEESDSQIIAVYDACRICPKAGVC